MAVVMPKAVMEVMMASRLKFLVVEDEENVAQAIKAILSRNYNSSIDIAQNVKAAMDSVRRKQYDFIISNWNLPETPGDEFLLKIRKDERTKHIPFLMVTARADRNSVLYAIQSGVSDFLQKPFEKSSLIEKIDRIIVKDGRLKEQDRCLREVYAIKRQVHVQIEKGDVVLPMLPESYVRLSMLKGCRPPVLELARELETDVTLCARLIHMSETCFFPPDPGHNPQSVHINGQTADAISDATQSIETAITRIGMDRLCAAVLLCRIKGLFERKDNRFERLFEAVWERALARFHCLQRLMHSQGGVCGDVLEAALLQDMGALWLLRILESMEDHEVFHRLDMMTVLISGTHQELATILAFHWGFSAAVQELTAQPPGSCDGDKFRVLMQMADHVAASAGYELGDNIPPAPAGFPLQVSQSEEIQADIYRFVTTLKTL